VRRDVSAHGPSFFCFNQGGEVITRKDYAAIAEAINFYRSSLSPHISFDRDRYVALRELTNIFCEVFAEDNHRFDRERFLRACGMEATREDA
jgi:hypothetical protein